jgi:hypothetical protein
LKWTLGQKHFKMETWYFVKKKKKNWKKAKKIIGLNTFSKTSFYQDSFDFYKTLQTKSIKRLG